MDKNIVKGWMFKPEPDPENKIPKEQRKKVKFAPRTTADQIEGEFTPEQKEQLKGEDGKPGKDGKSAYEYAKEGGYPENEEQFYKKLAEDHPDFPLGFEFGGNNADNVDDARKNIMDITSAVIAKPENINELTFWRNQKGVTSAYVNVEGEGIVPERLGNLISSNVAKGAISQLFTGIITGKVWH
ncbi:MAG: hypothetical protein GX786_06425, partial [Clostridiales bacterium]|nr:hypothetical protein [Clostridiales bacterium]